MKASAYHSPCEGRMVSNEAKNSFMRKEIFFIIIVFIVGALVGCNRPTALCSSHKLVSYRSTSTYEPVVTAPMPAALGEQPKNIILMIGDGMGLPQTSCAWVANHGNLNITACPFTGLSKTYCTNRLITDSGAGGTALASGHKTAKAHIGTDPDGKDLTSLMGYAQQAGKSTGMSVVCRLCDATPADFCCHNEDRDDYDDLIADYLNCNVDYIAGGGMYFFTHRKDKRNIFEEMGEKGYNLTTTCEELLTLQQLPILAVVADSEYVVAPDRGTLFQDQTMHGIELLSKNRKGFFMMIEGSCIDDWCHANDLERVVEETLDFDRVAGDVLRWALADGNTLVIITADHETGGLTLLGGNLEKGTVECEFANDSHSNVMVPIYAFGPASENFTGVMENNELSQKLIDLIIKK